MSAPRPEYALVVRTNQKAREKGAKHYDYKDANTTRPSNKLLLWALLRVHAVVCAKVLDTADIVRDAISQQPSNPDRAGHRVHVALFQQPFLTSGSNSCCLMRSFSLYFRRQAAGGLGRQLSATDKIASSISVGISRAVRRKRKRSI